LFPLCHPHLPASAFSPRSATGLPLHAWILPACLRPPSTRSPFCLVLHSHSPAVLPGSATLVCPHCLPRFCHLVPAAFLPVGSAAFSLHSFGSWVLGSGSSGLHCCLPLPHTACLPCLPSALCTCLATSFWIATLTSHSSLPLPTPCHLPACTPACAATCHTSPASSAACLDVYLLHLPATRTCTLSAPAWFTPRAFATPATAHCTHSLTAGSLPFFTYHHYLTSLLQVYTHCLTRFAHCTALASLTAPHHCTHAASACTLHTPLCTAPAALHCLDHTFSSRSRTPLWFWFCHGFAFCAAARHCLCTRHHTVLHRTARCFPTPASPSPGSPTLASCRFYTCIPCHLWVPHTHAHYLPAHTHCSSTTLGCRFLDYLCMGSPALTTTCTPARSPPGLPTSFPTYFTGSTFLILVHLVLHHSHHVCVPVYSLYVHHIVYVHVRSTTAHSPLTVLMGSHYAASQFLVLVTSATFLTHLPHTGSHTHWFAVLTVYTGSTHRTRSLQLHTALTTFHVSHYVLRILPGFWIPVLVPLPCTRLPHTHLVYTVYTAVCLYCTRRFTSPAALLPFLSLHLLTHAWFTATCTPPCTLPATTCTSACTFATLPHYIHSGSWFTRFTHLLLPLSSSGFTPHTHHSHLSSPLTGFTTATQFSLHTRSSCVSFCLPRLPRCLRSFLDLFVLDSTLSGSHVLRSRSSRFAHLPATHHCTPLHWVHSSHGFTFSTHIRLGSRFTTVPSFPLRSRSCRFRTDYTSTAFLTSPHLTTSGLVRSYTLPVQFTFVLGSVHSPPALRSGSGFSLAFTTCLPTYWVMDSPPRLPFCTGSHAVLLGSCGLHGSSLWFVPFLLHRTYLTCHCTHTHCHLSPPLLHWDALP